MSIDRLKLMGGPLLPFHLRDFEIIKFIMQMKQKKFCSAVLAGVATQGESLVYKYILIDIHKVKRNSVL